MSITPALGSVSALYRKLERESYRAFHSNSAIHKADHFFNFCVTAHAMRDYCLEYLCKLTKSDKQPFHDAWNAVPSLVAAMEIANSAKHFVLRDRNTKSVKTSATRAVRAKRSTIINVYSNNRGDYKFISRERPDVSVTLSDGNVLELYQFTDAVMKYWRSYLLSLGIKLRRQPHAQLSGKISYQVAE